MIIKDDRTESQKDSHYMLVVGTDKFLSGWGRATGGMSYAAWACGYNELKRVRAWVASRGDMLRVRTVYARGYSPDCAHLHIYVAREGLHYQGGDA